MRKCLLFVLCCALIFSLCACKTQTPTSTDPTTPQTSENLGEKYSKGLQENGFYENYETLAPEYTYDLTIKEADLKAFVTSTIEAEMATPVTFDEYLEMYANDFLYSMGLDRKEVVDWNDAVLLAISFKDANGEDMSDYQQDAEYYIVTEDSDEIISSVHGHSLGDVYSVGYTFPETDSYHPNETVSVQITVQEIYYADAFNSGVVEKHLDELREVFPDVNDAEGLKQALYPLVLGYHMEGYITEQLTISDLEVPQEWTAFEIDRLNARLEALGMTMEQYLEAMAYTEEDVRLACEQIARQNVITMALFPVYFDELTDEDFHLFYGEENMENYISLQGKPYLALRLMREMVFAELEYHTEVLDENNNIVDLSAYFNLGMTDTEDVPVEENLTEE